MKQSGSRARARRDILYSILLKRKAASKYDKFTIVKKDNKLFGNRLLLFLKIEVKINITTRLV